MVALPTPPLGPKPDCLGLLEGAGVVPGKGAVVRLLVEGLDLPFLDPLPVVPTG